jgi:hypothetical protein
MLKTCYDCLNFKVKIPVSNGKIKYKNATVSCKNGLLLKDNADSWNLKNVYRHQNRQICNYAKNCPSFTGMAEEED